MEKQELIKMLFKEIYGAMVGEKYMALTDDEMYDQVSKILAHYKSNHNVG